MAGTFIFSGSYIQSGSSANFENGLSVTESIDLKDSISATKFIGNGQQITNISIDASGIALQFGSASGNPPEFEQWITGSADGRSHEILLTASASSGEVNHFSFLKNTATGWQVVSDYTGQQNGLLIEDTLVQTLGTGIYRYLLLGMSTASRSTTVKGTTVVINPDSL